MNVKKILNLEILVTSMVMTICIVSLLFFPAVGIAQKIISGIIFFIGLPILYIKIVLKKDLKSFFRINFSKIDRNESLIMALMFITVLLVFLAINKYTGFSKNYFLKNSALVKEFWGFAIYELLIANLFVVIYEFFFRGFVMSYFLDKVGKYAILVQFLLFLFFMFLNNGLSMTYIYYIIIALPAGVVAYKTKSVIYSYIFSLISIIIGDIIFLILQK